MTTYSKRKVKDLKLGKFRVANDSLVILERGLASKTSRWQQRQLPPTERLQNGSQVPQRKESCLSRFLKADVSALFWKQISQRTLLSKEEKRAGGDRLTLVCANQLGMIQTALICTDPWVLKEKEKCQGPVSWLDNKMTWTMGTLSLDGFPPCFAPEVRKYLASKRLPFKVFGYCTMPLLPRIPWIQHQGCLLYLNFRIMSSRGR